MLVAGMKSLFMDSFRTRECHGKKSMVLTTVPRFHPILSAVGKAALVSLCILILAVDDANGQDAASGRTYPVHVAFAVARVKVEEKEAPRS